MQYREVGTSSFTTVTDLNTNSYSITGLNTLTDYEVQVNTRCISTTSSFSGLVSFTTAPPCTGTLINTFPYSESFDNTLGDWTQNSSDDFNWSFDFNSTQTNNTGPTGPSNGSHYLYTESSSRNNFDQAIITSPCFNLDGKENTMFSFDYHMYGDETGYIALEVSTNNGDTWTEIQRYTGEQQTSSNEAWRTHNEDLSSYDGSYIKLRFIGQLGNLGNGQAESDMALDAIGLTADTVSITPFADCQNLTVTLDSSGNAIINPSNLNAGSSIGNLSINISSFDCSNIGTVDVTLTATDPNNSSNTDTCIAVVTVESNTTWYLDCLLYTSPSPRD